jgi:hypothetical protein
MRRTDFSDIGHARKRTIIFRPEMSPGGPNETTQT